MSTLIELKDIMKTYVMGDNVVHALNHVDVTIDYGEFTSIMGASGSGKSTMVQHLNGLIKPLRGNVSIDGIDIAGRGSDAKQARQQVGMVFQYPEHQIFAETVYEDIAFGPRNRGFSAEEVDKQVHEAMAFVGLDFDTFAQRIPFTLLQAIDIPIALPHIAIP